MKRYFVLLSSFLKLSWMVGMEYRINFIIWLLVDLGWGIADLYFYTVLLRNIQAMGHWGISETLVVVGIFRVLMVPAWGWFTTSFEQLPKMIHSGQLDMLMTKPVDSQFMVSCNKFAFSLLSSAIVGPALIWAGLVQRNIPISLVQIGTFILSLIATTFLMYSVFFLLMTACLFTERLNNIVYVFTSAFDMARYPKDIYAIIPQRIFTSIFPVALMVSVPADILFGFTNPLYMFQLLGLGILFFIAGRTVWFYGLRRYTSASS